jgi:hypothetical protein
MISLHILSPASPPRRVSLPASRPDGSTTLAALAALLQLDFHLARPGVSPDEVRLYNNDFVRVKEACSGLLGGKGGFGAGLRAMGKSASARSKIVTDFSMCRDLQGRRVGHAHNALKLEKLQEGATDVSGDTWLLPRPGWAEPDRRKRPRVAAPAAAGTSKGKAAAAAAAERVASDHGFSLDFAREREDADRSVQDAVLEGLSRSRRAGPAALAEQQQEPSVLPEGVKVLSGQAKVLKSGDVYLVTGSSEFCTVLFSRPAAVAAFQAKALTEGLVQIGMLDEARAAGANDATQDGVGDFAGSWSFDGARGVVWAQGEPRPLAEVCTWVEDDVVSVRRRAGTLVFALNGAEMAQTEVDDALHLLPAVSLEEGEAVALRFDGVEVEREEPAAEVVEAAAVPTVAAPPPKPTDAKSLEAMGADALKQELKALGLKFGGTLQERARRLFIARTVPRADWPTGILP